MFQWRSEAFAMAQIGLEKSSWHRFLVIYRRHVVRCYGNVTFNEYLYLVADWLRGEHFQPIRETCSSILFVLQPYCSASQWNLINQVFLSEPIQASNLNILTAYTFLLYKFEIRKECIKASITSNTEWVAYHIDKWSYLSRLTTSPLTVKPMISANYWWQYFRNNQHSQQILLTN